jgi:SAM-dependent methyltransferase
MEVPEYLHMYDEEVFHWWYAGMRTITLSVLPPDCLPPSPAILDAGCGTGYNIGWLRQNYGAAVTGLDFSSHALEFCRRRGAQDLVRADIASVPLSSNNYDLVLCFDVLTHLKDAPAREKALCEFFRVLKPGGYLLLRVPAYRFLRSGHDDAVMAYHRYGMRELRTVVAGSGFEIVRLTGANALLFPIAVLWRTLKKIGLAPEGSDVRSTTRKGGLNQMLASVLRFEASLLRRFSFGFGLSIFLLAKKAKQTERHTI